MALELDRVRKLIERGLERYGRGQLEEAMVEWEQALQLDSRNTEARDLMAFVREKLMAGGDPAAWQNEFAVAPGTDGQGRTGWALADDPPPRSDPDDDGGPTMEVPAAAPAADAGKRTRTWGGHGRVQPVGIPGDPEMPSSSEALFPAAEVTTDPGPQMIAASLEELDWSRVNSDARISGDAVTRSAETLPSLPGAPVDAAYAPVAPAAAAGGDPFDEFEDAAPGRRSPKITLQSPIPALLAATMPSPSPEESTVGAGASAAAAEAGRLPGGSRPTLAFGAPGAGPPRAHTRASDAAAVDPLGAARKRAAELVDRARDELDGGSIEAAAEAAEFALTEGERAPAPGIAEVIEPARPLFERIFEAYVGPIQGSPVVTLTAHEIAAMTFDHRTGFLLSRIDGSMTIEEILDVSGMGAFDSFRILSSLLRAGIVTIR